MLKRLIIHLITATIGAFILTLIRDEIRPFEIVMFVVIYIGISIPLDYYRDRRLARRTEEVATAADAEKVKSLIEALGGTDNIETASHDGNRVKIKTKNVDLIDQDKLKELSLDGAVLTGDQLQISIGPTSEDFARLTIENVKENS